MIPVLCMLFVSQVGEFLYSVYCLSHRWLDSCNLYVVCVPAGRTPVILCCFCSRRCHCSTLYVFNVPGGGTVCFWFPRWGDSYACTLFVSQVVGLLYFACYLCRCLWNSWTLYIVCVLCDGNSVLCMLFVSQLFGLLCFVC